MAKSKTKTKLISFSEYNEDLLEHLKTVGNISSYVCNLIRKDMNGNSLEDDIRMLKEIVGSSEVKTTQPLITPKLSGAIGALWGDEDDED